MKINLLNHKTTPRNEHARDMKGDALLVRDKTRERRTDWLMRQFVDDIEEKLKSGAMDAETASARMTDRMVPLDVQARVIAQAGMKKSKVEAGHAVLP